MKKFLSMVLALVMAMSLVTFAPAAGAYNDDSSIQYKEAVDVISAIKIMEGYGDASFGPTSTLTRGAASKIICNMILGPTTAGALPTSVAPFPDVAAGSTFAGYIAYCSEHNIISGYADGNFRPGDSLSGYAFLKMLLCALGYDQDIEGYKGANWRVNVAKQALGIGLDKGLNTELDGSRIVTREEAALYAFNTLQADMVEYDTKTTVSVSGATVTVGGNNYHSKTASTQSSNVRNIDRATNQNLQIVQFGEEYFSQLVRTPQNHDQNAAPNTGDFGEPQVTWTWKGVNVGDYPNSTMTRSYTSDVKISTIYSDLNLSGTIEEADVYVNGEFAFVIDIERSNGDKLFAKDDQKKAWDGRTVNAAGGKVFYDNTAGTPFANACDKVGDGTLITVYYNEDESSIVITAKSVYPGQISSVKSATATKDAYVVVEYKGNDPAGAANYPVANFQANDYDEYTTDEAFAEDDMVWFTFSESANSIGEVHKMNSVEGKLDRRVRDSSLTLDGVKYSYGQEKGFDFEVPANGQTRDDALTNNSSYVVYLDSDGFVLYVEESEFATELYGLIERISIEQSNGGGVLYSALDGNGRPSASNNPTSWDTSMVRLLMSNGVERTVDLDGSSKYLDDNGAIKLAFQAGSIVRYVENSDGTYKLYSISGGAAQARSIWNEAFTAFSIDSHIVSGLYLENSDKSLNNTVTADADSETIFVVQDDDTFKVYTGKKNAPDVKVNTNPTAYAYVTGSGATRTAKIIFVLRGTPESSSKEITFLAGSSRSDLYESADTANYYEYNALVNGAQEIIVVSDAVFDAQTGNANRPTVYQVQTLNGFVGEQFSFNPNNGDEAWNSVILNSTGFDNDDIMTKGSFMKTGVAVFRTMGVKRTSNANEIKLGEYNGAYNCEKDGVVVDTINANKTTMDLANGCNIYYVDGDGVIASINYDDIHNDSDDVIYYTYDVDDAEITNLFILDFEV